MKDDESGRIPVLLCMVFAVVAAFAFTLNFDVLDIDSAQYAEISREMVESGNWLFLSDNGHKYLDKPIFTFWAVALSFKIFGVSNLAYRLPALLLTLLSLYSLYRIAMLLTGEKRKSVLAILLYASSPGVYAMLADPKTDVYLIAFLIFVHHFYYLGRKADPRWFYLMYPFLGLGFITKGPVSVIIPGISIGLDILIRRDWRLLASMRIPAGFFIAAALPVFWSYILYLEYEIPGVKHFLYEQVFGRIVGDTDKFSIGYDPLFFFRNFAWSFLLFIVPLTLESVRRVAVFFRMRTFTGGLNDIVTALRDERRRDMDLTIPFWLFGTLFLLCFSKFQIPQYLFWLLPAAAIYTAEFADDYLFGEGASRLVARSFVIMPVVLLTAAALLLLPVYSFRIDFVYYIMLGLTAVAAFFCMKHVSRALVLTALPVAALYMAISLYLYPEILKHQPAREAARIIRKLEPGKKTLYTSAISSSKRSYAFYAGRLTRGVLPFAPSGKYAAFLPKDTTNLSTVLDAKDGDFVKTAHFGAIAFYNAVKKDKTRLVLVSDEGVEPIKQFFAPRVVFETIRAFPAIQAAKPRAGFFFKRSRDRSKSIGSILLLRARLQE